MRWIVGLDLRPLGQGAIAMARWMAESTREGPPPRFVGVHVIPRPARVAVRDDVVDELCGQAVERARAVLREAGAQDVFERVEAIAANEPEETLTAAARYYGADGIVIGRHGPRDARSVVRLGAVARRLLRALPVATMIVPPEITTDNLGRGPVLAAADGSDSSEASSRMAALLARDTERELVMLHARPTDTPARRAILLAWAERHGIVGAQLAERQGDAVNAMLDEADERDAALLVCGTRRLSMAQRVFIASTATDLARLARQPVLVVPPESLGSTAALSHAHGAV